MKRTNTLPVSSLLHDFFRENPQLWQKILEIRIQRAWGELLGPMVIQSTQNLYVNNQVMYASISSSVLRNELLLSRKRLLKSLNEYAGAEVIRDIVIR